MLMRYAILGLLDGQELHGYRIKSAFEERVGPFWSLNFGQIYQTLKDLKQRGLVEGRFDRGDSHVGRWTYCLTPKGRRAFETWRRRPPKRPQPLRDEILIRLLLLDRNELAPTLAHLANQERAYREHLTRLTAHRRSLEPVTTQESLLNSLTADAALFRVEAHLKWLDHCAAVLTRWSSEGQAGASDLAGIDPGVGKSAALAATLRARSPRSLSTSARGRGSRAGPRGRGRHGRA